MTLRALRGATQLDVDEREHLISRVAELVRAVMDHNDLTQDDLVSIVFTATSDVHSEFPAVAARDVGLTDVPLLCAQELDVDGALPRTVRLLAYIDVDKERSQLRHVYLHGARGLRPDLMSTPQ